MRQKLWAVLIAGVMVGSSIAANAQAGVLIDYESTNGDGDTVTGTALLEFLDNATSPSEVLLNLTVSNTSGDDSMITGLGLDLPVDHFSSFSFDDTNGWQIANGRGRMNGFDTCIATTGPNCTGSNPNSGIEAGSTFSFGFSFNSDLSASGFEALTAGGYEDGSLRSTARYQRVGLTGDGSAFASGSSVSVPEPAMFGILGLGLLGMAAMRRQRLGLKS